MLAITNEIRGKIGSSRKDLRSKARNIDLSCACFTTVEFE